MNGDNDWSYGGSFSQSWPNWNHIQSDEELDRAIEDLIAAILEDSVVESDCNTARNMLADIGIRC